MTCGLLGAAVGAALCYSITSVQQAVAAPRNTAVDVSIDPRLMLRLVQS